jgi:hypothetical protein
MSQQDDTPQVTIAGDWHDDDAEIVAAQTTDAPPVTPPTEHEPVTSHLVYPQPTRLLGQRMVLRYSDGPQRLLLEDPYRTELTITASGSGDDVSDEVWIASDPTMLSSHLASVIPLGTDGVGQLRIVGHTGSVWVAVPTDSEQTALWAIVSVAAVSS